MTSRFFSRIVAIAGTTFLAAASPASAGMPVGAASAGVGGYATLVQDQAASAQKKSATRKSKRQKEIDSSVESGTVPKRYRTNVPKEYHHLIPFAK